MPDEKEQVNDNQQDSTSQKDNKINPDELIKKTLAKNSSSKTRGRISDPSKSAKDALKTITNLTQSIDVNDIVDSVLRRTEFTMSKQMSWPDVIAHLEKDDNAKNVKTNELVDEIIKDNATNSIMSRKLRYNEYKSSIKKLPILNKILRVYTSNILAPDDITKIAVRIVPIDTVLEDDESIKTITGKYTVINNKIGLENYVADIVYKTLFLGDYFLEIQSSKRSLIQTLYNLQIPIIENSQLNKIVNNFESEKKIKPIIIPSQESKRTYKLSITECANVMDQIENTTKLVKNVINEVFDLPSDGLLTESEFKNKINANEFTKNMAKVLTEAILGGANVQSNISANASSQASSGSEVKHEPHVKKEMDYADDLQHVIDSLPIEASLSNIILKPLEPDKVVVLEKDDICYGYLYINGIFDMAGSTTYNTGTVSSIATNTFTNGIASEKYANQSVVTNFVNKLSDYLKDKFGEKNDDGTSKVNIEELAPGLQQLISDILNSASSTTNVDMTVKFIPPSNIQHFRRQGSGSYMPYGESMLDDLMFMARMVLADNISSTINKISKVGKRMTVSVRGNTQQQAINNIMNVKTSLSRQIVTMDKLGSMDTIPNQIGTQKTIYIPMVNDVKQMEIDSLDMGSYSDQSDPNNNMMKQLITSADIPPTHLGYDEYTNSKANLTSENVVFAQNILAAQKEFANQFTELMQKIYIALYLKTKTFDTAYREVRFAFNAPRSIMLNTFAENLAQLDSIMSTLQKLDVPKDKIVERYFPELITFDLKINQTIEKLSNKGNNNQSDDGFAPFDSGGGNMDFSGLNIGDNGGGGGTPPPANMGGGAQLPPDSMGGLPPM